MRERASDPHAPCAARAFASGLDAPPLRSRRPTCYCPSRSALESSIRQAARDRHDVVSEKIAHVEELMSKYGAKHPELIPKLRELESHLAHPDMAHANQEKRLEQARRVALNRRRLGPSALNGSLLGRQPAPTRERRVFFAGARDAPDNREPERRQARERAEGGRGDREGRCGRRGGSGSP